MSPSIVYVFVSARRRWQVSVLGWQVCLSVTFCPRGPARVVRLLVPSRINLMAAELFSTVKAQRLINILSSPV